MLGGFPAKNVLSRPFDQKVKVLIQSFVGTQAIVNNCTSSLQNTDKVIFGKISEWFEFWKTSHLPKNGAQTFLLLL